MLAWIKDQNNVTFLIAVLSFFLSSASWIYTWIKRRKRLKFTIQEARARDDVLFFFLQIENESELPIAITRIQVLIDGKFIDCTAIPEFVYGLSHRSGDELVASKDFFSMQMPIELNPLGAVSGFVLFEGLQTSLPPSATQVIFRISTNRGKAEKIELPLFRGALTM